MIKLNHLDIGRNKVQKFNETIYIVWFIISLHFKPNILCYQKLLCKQKISMSYFSSRITNQSKDYRIKDNSEFKDWCEFKNALKSQRTFFCLFSR